MKDKIAYLLLILVMLVGIPYQAGLFQDSSIYINEIHINKLPFSQYTAIFIEDSVDENNQHYRIKREGTILCLVFNNYFTYSETTITFGLLRGTSKNFNAKCKDAKILLKDEKYELDTLYYSDDLLIHFASDNKEDLNYFYKQICDK